MLLNINNLRSYQNAVKKLKTTLVHRKILSSLSSLKEEDNLSHVDKSTDANSSINCNRSGLLDQHRNILYNLTPYKKPSSWIHITEKYQRKNFGRYGSKCGASPRLCFYSKSDVSSQAMYEQLLEPKTLQFMISKSVEEKQRKIENIHKRENEITKKIEKLEQWKQELHLRVMRKEADALAAKQKKERIIEEVRRHFGYKVDSKDERFKEVLEQKEREDKKKQKDAKRQAKEEKLISKLVGSSPSK